MANSQAEQLGPAIRSVQPRPMGALPLIHPILTALQLPQTINALVPTQADIDLGRIVALLLYNRLLAPQPLYHVGEWLAETVLPQVLEIAPAQVYDNRLGRALDDLHPHLGEVWARLVTQAIQVYDLDLRALHWDVTSLYFEGAYTDSELAAYGYSRDHRSDTKQVNLEVDVTHDGYVPVLYQVVRGNTADVTRPPHHLQALLRLLARPELAARHLRPILVSDCKMVTPPAVLACHRHQLFYLGPVASGVVAEAVLGSVPAAELTTHPLAYRPQRIKPEDPRFVPYQGVWRTLAFEHAGQAVADRVLVVWSAAKQRLDEKKRKTYLKRLLNQLAGARQRLNTRRYKKRAYVEQRLRAFQQGNPAKNLVDIELAGADESLTLTFRVNRAHLAAAQALDGRYLLATNADHLSADETLTLFKGQDGVEKRFRGVKGPLAVHPLFVHQDRRIEGLVFITLVALLVQAILERLGRQHGLAIPGERLFAGFATLQAVDVSWADGSQQRLPAEMSSFQAQVLHTLGWPLPETYLQAGPLPR